MAAERRVFKRKSLSPERMGGAPRAPASFTRRGRMSWRLHCAPWTPSEVALVPAEESGCRKSDQIEHLPLPPDLTFNVEVQGCIWCNVTQKKSRITKSTEENNMRFLPMHLPNVMRLSWGLPKLCINCIQISFILIHIKNLIKVSYISTFYKYEFVAKCLYFIVRSDLIMYLKMLVITNWIKVVFNMLRNNTV